MGLWVELMMILPGLKSKFPIKFAPGLRQWTLNQFVCTFGDGAVAVNMDAHGLGDTDGLGHLNHAPFAETMHLLQKPLATRFLAIHRATEAADLSTLEGLLHLHCPQPP